MSHVLVAVFENRADADRAREELINAGYADDTVRLNDASSTTDPADDGSIGSGIRHFFAQLFNRDHEDQHIYAEAIGRGHAVLTVQAAAESDLERAADIIEVFRPLDIDEQQRGWHSEGWLGGVAARSGLGVQQSALGAQQSSPQQRDTVRRDPQDVAPAAQSELFRSQQGTSAQGAMQRAESDAFIPPAGYDPIGTGQSATRRGAARIYSRDGGAAPNQDSLDIQRGDTTGVSEDTYFQAHWDDKLSYTGGTYQEYDPAYRYGASMANSTAYHGRPWDDAESDLRETWQHSYPESSWDKFKEAVREGWDRVTRST